MKCNKLRVLVAMMMIVTLLCGSVAMAASQGARVFSASMGVYNRNGKLIGALRRGTSITVTAVSGNRARISYKGRTGYAKLSDIVFNKHIKAVTTKTSSIKFLTRNSYKKRIYYTGTLAKGVTIYLAGVSGNNYIFFDKSGNTLGMVNKSAVRRL